MKRVLIFAAIVALVWIGRPGQWHNGPGLEPAPAPAPTVTTTPAPQASKAATHPRVPHPHHGLYWPGRYGYGAGNAGNR